MQEICDMWQKDMKGIRRERRLFYAVALAVAGIKLTEPLHGLGGL